MVLCLLYDVEASFVFSKFVKLLYTLWASKTIISLFSVATVFFSCVSANCYTVPSRKQLNSVH